MVSDVCDHTLIGQKAGHESVTSTGDQVGISLPSVHTEAGTVVFRSSICSNYLNW